MIKYGLIGKSLSHSFSQSFFTSFFQKNSIEGEYHNLELDSLANIRSQVVGYKGLNVTIPYKQEVLGHLDSVVGVAKEIGAVNTIKVAEGKWIGYNTDVFGFHQSIKPFLTNKHERALVFGTGGASKAVVYVLEQLGIDVVQVSRNAKNGQFTYEDINAIMIENCKLIINTTPVGMFPKVEEFIAIPFEAVGPEHLVVDLIYNPEKTVFLKKAEQQGAQILNGHSMLKEQALESYRIWNE